MPDFNSLGFAFTQIKTQQFAVTEEAYRKTGELSIKTDVAFGISEQKRRVLVVVKFRFYKKETPFISIEVEGYFDIDKADWQKLQSEDEGIVLPEKLVAHLTVLTIGTTRGILHSKTEDTPYNKYILPTIDVTQIVKGDVIFSKEELAE